jgi:hypothetical protein
LYLCGPATRQHARRVAYLIQAPNKNTHESSGTCHGDSHYCRKATFSDFGEINPTFRTPSTRNSAL